MATTTAIPPPTDQSTTPAEQQLSRAKFCWGQPISTANAVTAIDEVTQESSPVVSFADVMSEQLASATTDGSIRKSSEEKEILDVGWDPGLAQAIRESLESSNNKSHDDELTGAVGGGKDSKDEHEAGDLDTSNDEILALLLQEGFDEEFQTRAMEEQSKKRHSVGGGSPPKEGAKEKRYLDHSFNSFKKATLNDQWNDQSDHSSSPEFADNAFDCQELLIKTEGDADQCDSEVENRDWDRFEGEERNKRALGKRGFAVGKDGKVSLTKHDSTVCGRRNACKVMEFSTQIQTGDGAGFDMKLSNNVYNGLRRHVVAEEKRSARLHEKKERSTAESVMDENSRLMMFKLINSGILDEINGAISTGKEANVYHGIGSNPEKQVTVGEVAIKVYKTTLNEFKNRENYIKDDFRFKDKFSKTNNRKMIWMWAEKEMHNLNRIRRAGIPCPEVVCLKKHILVMSFIGSDGKSAPTLKEALLTSSQLEQAYNETVEIMKRMYSKCDLIHADLSEFNLLWYLNRIWVIDVSQSVMIVHPHALQFLLRDCYNITNFFEKRGLVNSKTVADLFTEVCGKTLPMGNLDGIELLSQVEEYERNMEYLAHGMTRDGDPFDEMFAHSMQERENEKFFDPSDVGSFIPGRSLNSKPVEIKVSRSPPKYRK